jgi:hypothetical protein
MARDIDVSDPKALSLADRIYLQDRMLLPKGAKPVSNEERADLLEREQDSANADATDDERDLSQLAYVDWTKAELEEEIDARNEGREGDDVIARSGTKANLAERLTNDDAANED